MLESVCDFLNHVGFPSLKIAINDVLASFTHKPKIESEIMDGCNLHCEEFVRDEKMTHVGF